MSEQKTETKTVMYKVIGSTGNDPGLYVQLPLTVNKKGLKTFTIDLDEFELDATGTKDKNGQVVHYMTFKFTK